MTYATAPAALEASGYCPRTTPIDTLMAAPLYVGLSVAEAMESGDEADEQSLDDFLFANGFQEADFASEYAESVIEAGL